MRTGLTKKQKTTVIYFDEHSRIIEVHTHNTDLKKCGVHRKVAYLSGDGN